MQKHCQCGKPMKLLMKNKEYRLWACPPSGCGRLLLEDARGKFIDRRILHKRNLEVARSLGATWYYAEQNEETSIL